MTIEILETIVARHKNRLAQMIDDYDLIFRARELMGELGYDTDGMTRLLSEIRIDIDDEKEDISRKEKALEKMRKDFHEKI